MSFRCPDCSTKLMTELGSEYPISKSLTEAVSEAQEGAEIEIHRQCWGCGWREERTVIVSDVNVIPGEDAISERLGIVEEIKAEIDQIENLDALEAALEDVRRRSKEE